jgi:uncharacterized phosphosugar-binding protein
MYKENNNYLQLVTSSLTKIKEDKEILNSAKFIAQAYINKNQVFTFGTGHSHMLGEELYARAGG